MYKQQNNSRTSLEEIEKPDAQHRITLLMLMSLLLSPLSVAAYGVAVIAIMKGNYAVDIDMTHHNAKYLGLAVALLITLYLGMHWYVVIGYYQAINKQLFGIKPFILLYGLCILNLIVLCFTLFFDLYRLPIYMIPIILLGINGYLVYLRRHLLSGKPLD